MEKQKKRPSLKLINIFLIKRKDFRSILKPSFLILQISGMKAIRKILVKLLRRDTNILLKRLNSRLGVEISELSKLLMLSGF